MELSILIAKVISVIYISAGIAVLIGTVNINVIAEDLKKSSALTFVCGCVGIIAGVLLINYHNIWVNNWQVLITIMSWLFLIGGVVIVLFPKTMIYCKGLVTGSRYWGIFMVLFGMLFAYFGFIR